MRSQRVDWFDLPAAVRAAVASVIGPIIQGSNVSSGFSPGFVGWVETGTGRYFVKLCHLDFNARTPTLHEREALILRALPAGEWRAGSVLGEAPSPFTDGWAGVITGWIDGRGPTATQHDLALLGNLLDQLRSISTADLWVLAPLERIVGDDFLWHGLRRCFDRDGLVDDIHAASIQDLLRLEDRLEDACRGNALVHGDMRADNILLAARHGGEAAVAVDWPAACIGHAAFDAAMLACSLAADQQPEISPTAAAGVAEATFRSFDATRSTPSEQVDVLVAALFGHWLWASSLGPPPGIPGVRTYQRRLAAVSGRWLELRLSSCFLNGDEMLARDRSDVASGNRKVAGGGNSSDDVFR